jgi:radical SAM superfamily enzyme YgiQ (UPF0313 family)
MSLRPMDSEFKRIMSPSLALLTLASLTPAGHEVAILDENTGYPVKMEKPDLVGITVNVDNSDRAYQLSAKYRDRGIPVVLGGIHVTANPDEASRHADAVCLGEAEELWEHIIEDTANHCLKPFYKMEKAPDLAKVPPLRWDLLPLSRYLYTNVLYSSRGCPFRCEFCYNSAEGYRKREYRTRPVGDIIRDIQKMGTKHIMFIDDNFIGNPQRARELIKAMKPLGLTWNTAVSANIMKFPGLLDEMKESGCQSLFIGFESINNDSIQSVGKVQNQVKEYEKLVSEIHQREMMVNASLVFGFDHDTPQVFPETLSWLVRNKIETMTAHILTPYPGTRLFARLEKEGRIIERDKSKYNTAHAVFKPKNMSPDTLQKGYLNMYKEFYSLPNIYRRLPENHHQRTPYLLFNFLYRKYGKATSILSRMGFSASLGWLARRFSYGID